MTLIDKRKQDLIQSVRNREPASNMMVAEVLLFISILCIVVRLMFNSYFKNADEVLTNIALLYNPIITGLVCYICIRLKGIGRWQKYALVILSSYCILIADVMSGYKSRILYSLVMLLAMRYYNKKFLHFCYVICVVNLGLSVVCNAYLYNVNGFIDLNTLYIDKPTSVILDGFIDDVIINNISINRSLTLQFGMILTFIPNFIFLSIFLLIIMEIMKNNLNIILALNDEIEKEKQKEVELVNTRTKVILSQVKPHFIYNALTSIASLISKDPNKAKELTINFSKYLRSNLDSIAEDSVDMISFDSELKHVENYLNIELVRFEDTLKVKYEIEYSDFSLPSLTVQPLVENAVKHGICKKEDGGTLTIKSSKIDGYAKIEVIDDGVGFDVNNIDDGKVHIGLNSIRQRLDMCNGSLTIDSEKGKGSVATILIRDGEIQ